MRVRASGRSSRWPVSAALLIAAGVSLPAHALDSPRQPFPEVHPASRAQAVDLLSEEAAGGAVCLTPIIEAARRGTLSGSDAATRGSTFRALDLLEPRSALSREQSIAGPDGVLLRFTTASDSHDRVDPTDRDGDGLPDLVQATLRGLDEAHALLVDRLGLTAPADLDVTLARLDGRAGGYLIATPSNRNRLADGPRAAIVLDSAPATGLAGAREAAVHQYAHAVVSEAASEFPSAWSEALAVWTVMKIDGHPDDATRRAIDRRLDSMQLGLLDERLDLGAGSAVWFAFLDSAYGPSAVRSTIDALASGSGPVGVALDRGLRRVTPDGLAAALREFHVWSVLVGERSDGRHFGFAGELSGTRFASEADGLPALSVQSDPAVAPFGTAQVRLTPTAERGGLRLHFEGEIASRWETDLLLFSASGSLRRVPLALSADERGEVTVPLDDVAEAWLLIRSVGSDDGLAHRYTYSAHREDGFPFELASLDAETQEEPSGGVLVSWQTASEQRLVGFNVLRLREDGGAPAIVNPVWVPARGDPTHATSYRFLDRSAEPGVDYLYRIQGITRDGLTSESDPVVVRAPAASR